MKFTIESEQEADGRWLAEATGFPGGFPGVLAYGKDSNDAMAEAEALALRVLAEKIEHDEWRPMPAPDGP